MSADDLMMRLQSLHERARQSPLLPDDLALYEETKELVARAICSAQRTTLRDGQVARSAFRMAILYKVEVVLSGSLHRAVTMDVSLAGFTALLPLAPAPPAPCVFKMMLKESTISGLAEVTGSQRTSTAGSHRVSFAFTELKPAEAALLEAALFDAVLARVKPR